MENIRKIAAKSPRGALKRKIRVEEGGALGLGVKKEHESTNARVQKMMKGRVAPFIVLTLVQGSR